jgi:beta-glucosidase/6-phospho-beta-glucosidase/beta-galactosidase
MKEIGIVPIMDLCHFGVPDWLENFQNANLPEALAKYARAFAERYDWIKFYTPVNEMYVTARMSALDGVWNEQLRTDKAFVTAVRNLARASALMMQAILDVRPDAIFVNSESSEFHQPCCPDEYVQRKADFENQRRFIALDLLYGVQVRPDIQSYLFDNGMPRDEYEWFMTRRDAKRAILGIDYYEWNEKLINSEGNIEMLGELFGWYVITMQYYDRYRRLVMHTETNTADADEAPNWLWRQWHNVQLIRTNGVPVVGFTWYSLLDQIDWNIGLRKPLGNVFPVGLFDLNRDPRPVAQAYRYLAKMYRHEPMRDGNKGLEFD